MRGLPIVLVILPNVLASPMLRAGGPMFGWFSKLNASHIYELVSASNETSRRMVKSCGLSHEPRLVCAMAISRERDRYTR